MNEVYEYRRTPSRAALLLSGTAVVLLVLAMTLTDAAPLSWLAWAMGAVTLGWLMVRKPAAGIRVDRDFLVLSAWRDPHPIPLDKIDFLRATEANMERDIAIVYKDGTEERTHIVDMPDLETLMAVLAPRGIAVRDVDWP